MSNSELSHVKSDLCAAVVENEVVDKASLEAETCDMDVTNAVCFGIQQLRNAYVPIRRILQTPA